MSEKKLNKEKTHVKGTKENVDKRRKDLLFLGFALFIIFLVLFWILQNPPQSTSIQTSDNKRANIEAFKESLINSNELLIVENVTGVQSASARYVYACGAGLAGSWGKIGKEISNMHVYVIDGESCTFTSPKIEDNELSHESTATNVEECMKKIKEMQRSPTLVTFYITYGPLYSIYESNAAYIFVNEDFKEECSFRTSESAATIVTQ